MALTRIGNQAITLDAAEIPNLDAGKITSGTFADARIAASNVSQHATSFDDNKIVNDISTLGLRVHTQENLNASNTNSASFDVFQDSSGITNLTNSTRSIDEYVNSSTSVFAEHSNDSNTRLLLTSNTTNGSTTFTDSSSNNFSIGNVNATHSTAQKKIGSSSIFIDSGQRMYVDTQTNLLSLYNMSNTYTIEFWIYVNDFGNDETYLSYGQNGNAAMWRLKEAGGTFKLEARANTNWSWSGSVEVDLLASGSLSTGQWYHVAFVNNSGSVKTFLDGVQQNTGTINLGSNNNTAKWLYIGSYYSDNGNTDAYWDSIRISNVARYSTTFNPNQTSTINATGSFEGNAITTSSTNKMGAVITYQDNAGTNALNTDIVLKLSADNGSNYSTATLTALPDFASGIKCAKVNDLSVTAGTQLKYKLEFANQASGSKEARIRGVSLQY